MKQRTRRILERARCIADLHMRLGSIASQATQAQRMGPEDDNLLDLIDAMDRDLQATIALINAARRSDEVD